MKRMTLGEDNKMAVFKSIGFPAAAHYVLLDDWICERQKRGKSNDEWRGKVADLKDHHRGGCVMDITQATKPRRMGPKNKYALTTTKQVMDMTHGSFKKYSLVGGAGRGDTLMACKFPGGKRVQEARLKVLHQLDPKQQIAFCKDQVYGADRPWSASSLASAPSSSQS